MRGKGGQGSARHQLLQLGLRICKALVVYWGKPRSMDMEVVLVRQDLGY